MIGTADEHEHRDREELRRAAVELVQQVDERSAARGPRPRPARASARAAAGRSRGASGGRARSPSVPSAVIRMTRWTVSTRVGQPGLVGHHQDVPRHARLAERVEAQEHQPQRLERDHHDRQRADQHAIRAARTGARAGSRPAGRPAAAARGRRARSRRSAAPAPSTGAAAARRTRPARSRASARRRGSPAAAPRPPLRWPGTTSRRSATTHRVEPDALGGPRRRPPSRPDARPATISERRSSAGRTRVGRGCSMGVGSQRDRTPTLTGCEGRALGSGGCPRRCRSSITSTCRTWSRSASRTATAHLDLIKRWHGDDRLVMAGAVGDPPYGGLLVFRVRRGRRGVRRRGSLRRSRAGREVVGRAVDGGDVMWERLASLPLEVEGYTLEKLTGGERVTTLLRLRGAGQEGVGEDVMRDPSDPLAEHDAFAAQAPLPLAGTWTLEGFCDHLATLEQWEKPPEWGDLRAALAQLGLRVGGARSRAAPGRPAAARGARARAAPADVRQLARARRRAVERHDRPPARAVSDASASSSTRRRTGRPRSSRCSAGPAWCGRSTSRAATGSRSPTRTRSARCTTRCSRRSRTRSSRTRTSSSWTASTGRRVVVRRPGHARRGHHHADHQRQAVADRRPAAAVRDLRARRGRGPADVRRRDGRARARAPADPAARVDVPSGHAERRRAVGVQPPGVRRPGSRPARSTRSSPRPGFR